MRKGERLVLMTSDTKVARENFVRHVRDKGVSELNIPADIMLVDKVPLLGSGKADFVTATKLAKERLAAKSAA